MKKLWALIVLIASAILSGALIFNILKKAGLDEAFNFDLDPEEEEFYEYI